MTIFFQLFSGHPLLPLCLATFVEWVRKWSQNGRGFCCEMAPFFDRFPQSGHSGPQGGSRPPKRHQHGAQGCQHGAPRPPKLRFWTQKCGPKGTRVLSFRMIKKDRNGWYQYTNTLPTNHTNTQNKQTLSNTVIQ